MLLRISEFHLACTCFPLDPLRPGSKGENKAVFPNRWALEAAGGSAAQAPAGSGSFLGTGYCLHDTMTGTVRTKVHGPGHSPPAATDSAPRNTPAQEHALTPKTDLQPASPLKRHSCGLEERAGIWHIFCDYWHNVLRPVHV